MLSTIGVLVMAYGTPQRMEDVRPYLTHIRHGHEPSDEAVEDLKRRYELIGGPSPLYRITVDQMQALETRLNLCDGPYRAYLGMKHWHPFIRDAVKQMAEDGIEEAVAIALAPHYSTMSIAQYLDFIRQALDELDSKLRVHCIKCYHDEPLLIDAMEEKLRATLSRIPEEERDTTPTIFTAHSLPEKILRQNDPYQEQLFETCRLLAEKIGDGLNWRFAFTSQGDTTDRWLGPTLAEALDEVAAEGHRSVLAASVGFVSEHLETLHDLDFQGAEGAKERGLNFYRAPALNSSPKFIQGLAELVRKTQAGAHDHAVTLPGSDDLQAPTYPSYE